MKRLSDTVMVAGQIAPEEVGPLAEAGLKLIVNNRPDGEEPGQPPSAAIEAAAEAAGVAYAHIPIAAGFSEDKVEALRDLLADAPGQVLLFCRSGTRSACLWALARARDGVDADEIVGRAARAGYDVRPLLPWLKPAATRPNR